MRKSIRDAILAETNAAKAILDLAEKEGQPLSDVQKDQINEHMSKASDLQDRSDKEEAFRKQMVDLSGGLGLEPEPLHKQAAKERGPRRSIGDTFTDSKEFKALIEANGGRFSEKQRVHSDTVHIGSMKSLIWSSDHDQSVGPAIVHDDRGLLDPFYARPLTVRSLFTSGSTASDHLDFVRMINTDNNAAVVPEAQTHAPIDPAGVPPVTAAQGGLKPESGFELERDSTPVRALAHWIPITKRALADVSYVRSMIDTFLRYGLEEALEVELITGDGTGEHFLGLNNTPGIQTQAVSGDAFDTTRKARTKVQIGGRTAPTAYVMHPSDWEAIDLMRTNTEKLFYGAGPFAMSTPRLWGLPVVQSEAMTPKTAYCADWRYGSIWDREQTTVTATDSHADFFVRNLVAILAEMRCAFAVLRPQAFVKITLP